MADTTYNPIDRTTFVQDADRKLACPACGQTDGLRTIEEIIGAAGATFSLVDPPEFDGGTEMFWDTSTTVGVDCSNCSWEMLNKNAAEGKAGDDYLVPEPYVCDLCGEDLAEPQLGVAYRHRGTGLVACDPDEPDDEDNRATPKAFDA